MSWGGGGGGGTFHQWMRSEQIPKFFCRLRLIVSKWAIVALTTKVHKNATPDIILTRKRVGSFGSILAVFGMQYFGSIFTGVLSFGNFSAEFWDSGFGSLPCGSQFFPWRKLFISDELCIKCNWYNWYNGRNNDGKDEDRECIFSCPRGGWVISNEEHELQHEPWCQSRLLLRRSLPSSSPTPSSSAPSSLSSSCHDLSWEGGGSN